MAFLREYFLVPNMCLDLQASLHQEMLKLEGKSAEAAIANEERIAKLQVR